MTTKTYIDAQAVARELLDGAEVAYGYPDDRRRCTRAVDLPDGRRATLLVRFDESSSIGKWIDSNGKTVEHHDDIFGTFAERGTDRLYGYPAERPAGFDGRARVLRPRDHGARIGGDVWWQPPADVDDSGLPELEKTTRAYLERGEWEHVGLVCEVLDHGQSTGDSSVWGVAWTGDADADEVVELVAENLAEAGIETPSTAGVARWARDLLESAARRLSGADEGEEAYDSALRDLLGWWREDVESRGDWDTYADPVVARIVDDCEHRAAALASAENDLERAGYILRRDNAGRLFLDRVGGYLLGPFTDALEASQNPKAAAAIEAWIESGECPYCRQGQPPYPPGFHHASKCPRRNPEA